jgi:hypothetical protein
MLKFILIINIIFVNLFAIEYSVQIEPYQIYKVKSNTNGVVIYSNIELEDKILKKDEVFFMVDSVFEKNQLSYLEKEYKNNNKILLLKKENLEIILKSKNKNIFEKNNEKQNVLNLENLIFKQLSSINDLKIKLERKDFIISKGLYLSKIYIYENDYVNYGTLIAKYIDLSKIKLNVFVISEDYEDLINKKIYINGVENNDFFINKKSLVKDETNLSTFKIELISKNFNKFKIGDIVTVNFKKRD